MVSKPVTCQHCTSENVVRNGRSAQGKQRYVCRACGRRSSDDPRPHEYSPERREEILRAYDERSSLRGLERTFGVARQTVSIWLKKSGSTPHRSPKRL